MPRDPLAVAHGEARAGDDVEALGREAHDREIGLDAATLVAKLRVHDRAVGFSEIVGGDALERVERAAPGELEFAERALVEKRDALAHGAMLCGHGVEPVRFRFEARLVSGSSKPVRSLPSEFRAVDRAALLEDRPERAAARVARDGELLAGIVQLVVRAVRVHRALVQRARARVKIAEAPQVEGPEI